MPARKDVYGASNYVLQESINALVHEEYTNAKRLISTGITGPNPEINKSTETYIGQLRWYKPMNPNVNVADLADAAEGALSTYDTDFLKYIKTARTYGGQKVNLQHLITQSDGLMKISRDFVEHRSNDEDGALLSLLKGVAISEAIMGVGGTVGEPGLGGQTFENDPRSKRHGFYVDFGPGGLISAAGAAKQGAQRGEAFLEAIGMAYKDYEPPYFYLACSPQVLASLRSANLVDQDRIRDGNIDFETIYKGKFRLLVTRSNQSLLSNEITKLNTGQGGQTFPITGPKTSFLIQPGAIAREELNVEIPVEVERRASTFKGGGSTRIWYRWAYVLHPAGYDWHGSEQAFPADAAYQYAKEGATLKALGTVTNGLADTVGTWTRKSDSALSLGILPIFHA